MEDKDIINNSILFKNFKIGIYFLIDQNKIVYVGQTKCGLSRVFSHTKDKIFNSYSFIECDINMLSELESYYIIKFNPKYNKSINKGARSINSIKNILKTIGINNKYHDKRFLKKLISELGYHTNKYLNQEYVSEECYQKIYKIIHPNKNTIY